MVCDLGPPFSQIRRYANRTALEGRDFEAAHARPGTERAADRVPSLEGERLSCIARAEDC